MATPYPAPRCGDGRQSEAQFSAKGEHRNPPYSFPRPRFRAFLHLRITKNKGDGSPCFSQHGAIPLVFALAVIAAKHREPSPVFKESRIVPRSGFYWCTLIRKIVHNTGDNSLCPSILFPGSRARRPLVVSRGL